MIIVIYNVTCDVAGCDSWDNQKLPTLSLTDPHPDPQMPAQWQRINNLMICPKHLIKLEDR